jgi:hypothetical protein
MTIRTFAATLTLVVGIAAPAWPQSTPAARPTQPTPRTQATPRLPVPPAPPAPPAAPGEPVPPPPPPAPPRRAGQPVNVKIDVTITDAGRTEMPTTKKTVSVVTGDGLNGRIRSTANYSGIPVVPLNVDAEPEILADGKIRVRVNLQYSLPGNTGGQPAQVAGAGELRFTEIQENLSLVLENGKPIIAAQSADPVGDRQVTIEVKATVLK